MTADPHLTGIIIRGVGGLYWIDDGISAEPIPSRARGIFRKDGITPLVGDHVVCTISDDPLVPLQIITILERRNELVRPPVANLDLLIITFSYQDPAPDPYLIDKLLILCAAHRIDPVLCLTKTDQIDDPAAVEHFLDPYEAAGYTIIRTGFNDRVGQETLLGLIAGRVVSFAGQSGVGKSTLLNDLFGTEKMPTGIVSDKAGRGKHTTRHVELFPFAGGYVADTPGFSSLELETLGIRPEDVLAGYPEIAVAEGQCRFIGCRHIGEAGCAVDSTSVDAGRLERYRYFRNMIDSIKLYQQRGIPRPASSQRPL